MTTIKKNAAIIFLVIVFTFIFFYKLDYNTLQSWDEAWYAEIARQIYKTGDILNMVWNGKPYFDHPPMGFWLMATSYKLFGVSEFATRFPSAVLGLLSIVFVYLTAVKLSKNKIIGLAAGLILGTSVWFVLRVRSGNLESPFVFFYILTVYLSLKSSQNFKWFPLTMASFGALILSKTLVGASAAVLILFLNFKQLINVKKNFLWLVLGILLFCLLVFPWYQVQFKKYPNFYDYHFIQKGTRDKTFTSFFNLMPTQPLFYVHMGIRKWYRFWQASVVLSIVSFFYFLISYLKKRQKKIKETISIIVFLLLWNFVILYPFLTSEKTELWHLIPTYLPISLVVAFIFYEIGMRIFSFLKLHEKVFQAFYLCIIFIFSFIQIKNFWKEVYPQSKYITDQVEISRRLTKYNEKIYLDIDYLPDAIFYSGKHIDTLVYESNGELTFTRLFEIDGGNVIGVTKNWVVEDLVKKKFPITVLEKNNTYSIVTKPKA